METRFKTGQWVRAKVTAQGMVEGATYQVVDVHTLWTVVGGVTSYLLADGAGQTRWMGNGHLLLTEAAPTCPFGCDGFVADDDRCAGCVGSVRS